jgi:hypothetical protein
VQRVPTSNPNATNETRIEFFIEIPPCVAQWRAITQEIVIFLRPVELCVAKTMVLRKHRFKDAMILPYDANPGRMEFSETTSQQAKETVRFETRGKRCLLYPRKQTFCSGGKRVR